LFILRHSGSLSPGTAFPKIVSKIVPLDYLSKLEANPFTKLSLNY